jgi:Trk K+ transport system NAD-binding subunit
MKKKILRTLHAQVRDTYVLIMESRKSLIHFLLIIFMGAVIFHLTYTFPGTSERLKFSEALYVSFTLLFFSPEVPYPEQWYLQGLFFLIPIFGLAAVADGILRFGGALISKQARGQKWQVAMASTYRDHMIVCGVGRVGYRIILELLKFGKDIVAVEKKPEGRFVEKVKGMGIPIILADARRSETILKAGVDKADAIIPCTDDELTNLDIALDAREINPDIRVVMRMFDADFAKRVEKGFGIHFAFSTSAVSAPIFASAAMRENVKHSFYVGDNLLHISQIRINPQSELCGWTIGKLEEDLDLSVICHEKDGCTDLHPENDLILGEGEEILILASLETLRNINQLNINP